MRTIQTQQTFSLSSVKPLEGLIAYRAFCVEATRRALQEGALRWTRSPISGSLLVPCGDVDGLAYGRCPDGGGLFLLERAAPKAWGRLLAHVSRHRHSPEAFHAGLAKSRTDHVYAPKLEWIEDALRLQDLHRPMVLEVVTPPSEFTGFLADSGSFADVLTVDETELATTAQGPRAQAAVLLESLDRAQDPGVLLGRVADQLTEGGLLFVTALVASGFDLAVLGIRNLYLYPPDRANCFSLSGLAALLRRAGFQLLELSTPGVLDVEIVRAHLRHDPTISLSSFERGLLEAPTEAQEGFQTFLQQQGLSSFARLVARKSSNV